MIQLSLVKCNEGYKLVHVRNRCRIVWICEEYTCCLYGSFLFSGFNRFMHFLSTYANSWIKIAARQNIIWIRFGNRRAVRRRMTEAGMALTAIGEITQWGGVAGCSGSRTLVILFFTVYCIVLLTVVLHSTAISYPSIENLFNGCQGHPLVCLPPGTAQRQPDRIKKGSNTQQFIQLTVVGDINAKSGWSLKKEKIRLLWHVHDDTTHTLRHLFLTWTSLYLFTFLKT
jgi:hypothetical protein